MTTPCAPIDIECPACKAASGNYCTMPAAPGVHAARLTFHHAERIDAAFRHKTLRRDDPRVLREFLREAVTRLEKRRGILDPDDLKFIHLCGDFL